MNSPFACCSTMMHVREDGRTCSSSCSLLLAALPSVMLCVCPWMIALWAPSCLFCSLILHDSSEAHTLALH